MENRRSVKKHTCKDCHSCQFCSDSRCRACCDEKKCKKQLSLDEQIAIYERLNKDLSL